jgi:hypothetical protein
MQASFDRSPGRLMRYIMPTTFERGDPMSTKMKIAFVCHLLATLIVAGFGVTYLLRPEFMPYHAVAVGMPWAEVPQFFQVLILALMRVIGGACLAVVVMQWILLSVPFRQGVVWALWAIPAGGLVICAGALYGMLYVGLNTSATPPWIAPFAAALLLLAGLLFSLGQPKAIGA